MARCKALYACLTWFLILPVGALASPPVSPVSVGLGVSALSLPSLSLTGWGQTVEGHYQLGSTIGLGGSLRKGSLNNDFRYIGASGGLSIKLMGGRLSSNVEAGMGRYSRGILNGRRFIEIGGEARWLLAAAQHWSVSAGSRFALSKPGEKMLATLSPGLWFSLRL